MEKTKRLTRVCLAVVVLILVFSTFGFLQKQIEYLLFKKDSLGGWKNNPHHLLQKWAKSARQIPQNGTETDLLIMVHIPRTAFDSMKTTMFNQVDADLTRLSYIEFKESAYSCKPPCPLLCSSRKVSKKRAQLMKIMKRKKGNQTWARLLAENERIDIQKRLDRSLSSDDGEEFSLERASIIKGMFSNLDLENIKKAIPHRGVRSFTFLRHPMERILSFYELLVRLGSIAVKSGTVSRPEFFNISSEWNQNKGRKAFLQTYFLNSMVWQLGGYMYFRNRTTFSGREALERAKVALKEMEMVGFFEDMHIDLVRFREKLKHSINSPFLLYFAMWLGSFFLGPEHKVKRWLLTCSSEELSLVSNLTKLDMELWEWAIKEFRPDLHLYPDHPSLIKDWIFSWVSLLIIVLLSGCLFGWKKLKGDHKISKK